MFMPCIISLGPINRLGSGDDQPNEFRAWDRGEEGCHVFCQELATYISLKHDNTLGQALFQDPDQMETLPLELPEHVEWVEVCIRVGKNVSLCLYINLNAYVLAHSRRDLKSHNLSQPRPSNSGKHIRSGVCKQSLNFMFTTEHIRDQCWSLLQESKPLLCGVATIDKSLEAH